jgi:hypothetical protein
MEMAKLLSWTAMWATSRSPDCACDAGIPNKSNVNRLLQILSCVGVSQEFSCSVKNKHRFVVVNEDNGLSQRSAAHAI